MYSLSCKERIKLVNTEKVDLEGFLVHSISKTLTEQKVKLKLCPYVFYIDIWMLHIYPMASQG